MDTLNMDKSDRLKNIVLFAGAPDDTYSPIYYDGAMSVLNPFIASGKCNVIGDYAPDSTSDDFKNVAIEQWKADKAAVKMETILKNSDKSIRIDAILSPADHISAEIIKLLKKDPRYKDIHSFPVITGQDVLPDAIRNIMAGYQKMTALTDEILMAETAVKLVDALLKGETPNLPQARYTTIDNGCIEVPTYECASISITKDNLHEMIFKNGYYSEDEFK